jgi:3-oxoacyl-[acyl-carrier-protein] synthase III
MIGIVEIASWIPPQREHNVVKASRHETDEKFILEKIGIQSLSRIPTGQNTSDLCVQAFHALKKKIKLHEDQLDFLMVVTQNPDLPIPHSSAMVHGKLGLSTRCAVFDISLGCSGWVYALHTAISFMAQNDLKAGLIFTADPYSKVIDPNDKNTDMLFGDAASVTLLTEDPLWETGKGEFVSDGTQWNLLRINETGCLEMDGRGIFNFVMTKLPKSIDACLQKNGLKKDDIDLFAFHQASKFMIDQLSKRVRINPDKVPFVIADYGNTVSSSIPILLEERIHNESLSCILVSGFGVGLSAATSILKRCRSG